MRSTFIALCLGLPWVAGPLRAQPTDDLRLEAVEERFIAPCCWTEPLSVHDSPLARELREELRLRLARGDTPDEIETSLVARYGERVLSTPPGIEPTALGVLGGLALAGLLLGAAARRARPISDGLERPQTASDPRLDAELERELAGLDP